MVPVPGALGSTGDAEAALGGSDGPDDTTEAEGNIPSRSRITRVSLGERAGFGTAAQWHR